MKPVLIIYATREGQTRHIAEHVGAQLGAEKRAFEIVDAAHIPEGFSAAHYSTAIVGASLHMGNYEPEMVRFVKENLAELRLIRTLFLSVSLSEATAGDEHAPPDKRAEAQADVKRTIDRFMEKTEWHPTHVAAVAGALMYSKYDVVTRFVMRQIAKSQGGPSDTTRDYEFTDWSRLDQTIEGLVV